MYLNRLPLFCVLWTSLLYGAAYCFSDDLQRYPVMVNLRLEVDEVVFVDDHTERVGLKMKIISEWNDPYLNDSSSVDDTFPLKTRFSPEVFIETGDASRISHEVTRSLSDGKVQQLRVQLVTLKCKMHFDWMPVDVQRCSFIVRSGRHDKHFVLLNWTQDVTILPVHRNAVNFTLINIDTVINDECQINSDLTEWSCARGVAVFQRNHHSYLITFIIPTALMAILSWLTLFCRCSSVRATILLICTFSTGALMYVKGLN